MISISFRDFQQLQRRSSASEVEISSTTLSGGCNRHYIKMRLKELQKSRLMAVHDALVVVLEEMKASGEVSTFLLLLIIISNSLLPKKSVCNFLWKLSWFEYFALCMLCIIKNSIDRIKTEINTAIVYSFVVFFFSLRFR